MRDWYSASELAGLPGMPGTVQGIHQRAKGNGWTFRRRSGRGGGREYAASSLPKQARDHLIRNAAKEAARQLVAEREQLPTPAEERLQVAELSDGQRTVMQARLAICTYIDQLAAVGRMMRGAAIKTFLSMVASGELPDGMIDTLQDANARAGMGRLADRATIYRWFQQRDRQGAAAVAPQASLAQLAPAWLPGLLACYQTQGKPSISAALRDFREKCPDAPAPSLRTAQRHIRALPVEIAEWGRMGRRSMRSVQPFVRRSIDGLWPMDVVIPDGHLFKAYVRHPLTGRKVRPELTLYIDIATRKAVGFSAWLAESQLAIWAAFRDMVVNRDCGIPALHYSDRGAYKGERHRALLARVGSSQMLAEAYRAQARGVIERFNSSVWIPLARSLPTYCGDDVDPELFKRQLATMNGRGENLMGWEDFLAAARQAIDAYNDRPHSTLRRARQTISPNAAWAQAVAEGWRPTLLEGDDLHDILPSVPRTVRRGEVRLPWGTYYHDDLALYHGRSVRVHVHPSRGEQVWVADDRGALICVAQRDGNARPYIADTMMDHARAEREKGRVNRLERKLELVREEGAAQFEPPPSVPVDPAIHAETVAALHEDEDGPAQITDERKLHAYWWRIRERIDAGEPVNDEDARGCQVYWASQQARSMEEFFEAFELNVEDFG